MTPVLVGETQCFPVAAGANPHVEAIVMVGIAGGVPSPAKADDHVRLGDVVVSDRRGVVQYDFVKKTRKATEVRAPLRPPHARLLEAVRLLESDALAGSKPWEEYVGRADAEARTGEIAEFFGSASEDSAPRSSESGEWTMSPPVG